MIGQVLVTGVEDDPSGMLRMYVGPRYKWTYALIEDERDKETLRRAWSGGQHVLAPTPDADQLYVDEEGLARMRRREHDESEDTDG